MICLEKQNKNIHHRFDFLAAKKTLNKTKRPQRGSYRERAREMREGERKIFCRIFRSSWTSEKYIFDQILVDNASKKYLTRVGALVKWLCGETPILKVMGLNPSTVHWKYIFQICFL